MIDSFTKWMDREYRLQKATWKTCYCRIFHPMLCYIKMSLAILFLGCHTCSLPLVRPPKLHPFLRLREGIQTQSR